MKIVTINSITIRKTVISTCTCILRASNQNFMILVWYGTVPTFQKYLTPGFKYDSRNNSPIKLSYRQISPSWKCKAFAVSEFVNCKSVQNFSMHSLVAAELS